MDFGSLLKMYSDASTTASNLGGDLSLTPLLDDMMCQIDVSDCLEAVISAVETIVEVENIDFCKIKETIPPPPPRPLLNSTLDISDIITNDSTITNAADSITMTDDSNEAEQEAGSDSESDEETTDSNRPKKSKVRTVATKKREARCKLAKTLFRKLAHFISKTGQNCLLVTQNKDGSWNMLGTSTLERKLLSMRPIVDTRTDEVLQDDSMKALSLQPAALPTPKTPSCLPSVLSHVVPGGRQNTPANVQGPSSSYVVPKTPQKTTKPKTTSVKLFQKKGKSLNHPKETRGTKETKKKETSTKETGKKETGKKRAAPSASRERGRPSKKTALQLVREHAAAAQQDEESCGRCFVKWDDMDGDRCIQCSICDGWYCGKCSDTDTIPQPYLNKVRWYCWNCRDANQ